MYVVGVKTSEGSGGASALKGSATGGLYLFNDQANGNWKNTLAQAYDPAGRYFTPLPYGVSALDRPVSSASYGGRLYLTGGWTYNLVLDEHHRLWKQGIRGPEVAPTITGAAGTGAIGYLTWYDELTDERSPLSDGATISTATPRTWTLPSRPPDDIFVADGKVSPGATITPDSNSARTYYLRPGDRVGYPAGTIAFALVNHTTLLGAYTQDNSAPAPAAHSTIAVLPVSRATHIELWLSVAGGYPRLVMRLPIGSTTVTESTAVGNLGESFLSSYERFPRCSMNVIYNDRQIMAGDPDNPDIIYLSDLFFPERYTGLNFRTRSGEPVTGLLALRDYCLVFTRNKTYMLQGYTEADFTLTMVEQSLGSVGHQCNKVVHGDAYVWTEKGPYMFNGAWHPLSPECEFTSTAAGNAQWARAEVDPDSNTYMLISPDIGVWDRYLGQTSGILVFDYTTVQPETGGQLTSARLSVDQQNLSTLSSWSVYNKHLWPAYYNFLQNKWGIGRLYTVSYDSVAQGSFEVFQHRTMLENNIKVATGITGITAPNFEIIWGHHFFDEPGFSVVEGKTFQRLWFDFRHYNTGSHASLYGYPGDDDALELYGYGYLYQGLGFNYPTLTNSPLRIPVLLTHLQDLATSGVGGAGPVHVISQESLSGRGLTWRLVAPDLGWGASFKGFGGAYVAGPASRFGRPTNPI